MNKIAHHITGYHPLREIPRNELPDYKDEPAKLVSWGETTIKVYGYGLTDADIEDAAVEFMDKKGCTDLGVAVILRVK